METQEEFEEKVNLSDITFTEPTEENNDIYTEDLHNPPSQIEESAELPVLLKSVKKENSDIENMHKLKELRVVLTRLVLPLNGIKEEQFKEEDSTFYENQNDDDVWTPIDFQELIKDSNEDELLKLEVKEEPPTVEESNSSEMSNDNVDESIHETNLSVNKPNKHGKLLKKHNKPNVSYLCESCNYVFGVKSSFLDHKKMCNASSATLGNKTTFCFVCCEEIFKTFNEFNAHKFVKHEINCLFCGLCNYEVANSQDLCKHYREFHFPKIDIHFDDTEKIEANTKSDSSKVDSTPQDTTEKTTEHLNKCSNNEKECTALQQGILCQCSDCSRRICNKKVTKKKPSKPFSCKLCDLSFTYKSRLIRHKETHVGLKKFPCNICVRSFTKHTTLKKHILRLHSEASPFKVTCNICSKELSCQSTLNKHIRTVHLQQFDDFKVSCPYCNKTLSSSKTLKKHVKKHEQDTEYICAHCNRSFHSKENLVNHVISQHLPQEPVGCDICGHMAMNSTKLSIHKYKKHSEKKYSCEICGKLFGSKKVLQSHLVVHFDDRPFECETCGKTFKRETNLEQHKHSHSTERPHLCDICGQSFRLRTHVKQHLAVHGITKNHKCLVCNEYFSRKRELNLHMSKHNGD